MKKRNFYIQIVTLCIFLFGASTSLNAVSEKRKKELDAVYQLHCSTPSDINEHIPVLRELANECSSVAEIGIRSMVSTWGIIHGLAANVSEKRSYIGIDLNAPPLEKFLLARRFANENRISFRFIQGNDMTIQIPPVDMLFIDSLHTYAHLSAELEKFSPKVNKYIAMHDTSPPWGYVDDSVYYGDYSEYPAWIDRTKRGLWPAVEDFLDRHPEWEIYKRLVNNHGFTVLKRRK